MAIHEQAIQVAELASHLLLYPDDPPKHDLRRPGGRRRKIEPGPEDKFAPYEASSGDDNRTADVGPDIVLLWHLHT